MLNNRDLDYFIVAARMLNLGIASQNLNITQPALSKSIARLEKELGISLFSRSGRGLILTEAGEVLYQRGIILQHSREEIVTLMAELGSGNKGVVRIGSAGSATQYLLPTVCRQLQEEAPGIKLEIQIGMNDILFGKLERHELDIIIGPLVDYHQPVVQYPVTSDRVVVAASRNHPLAGKSATLRELARYGWILPAASVRMRQWLERVFDQHHCPPPEVRIEVSSLAAAPDLIASSGLLSFISENSLAEDAFASRLARIDIPQLVMERRVGITSLQDAWLSPATRKVIEVTRRYGQTENSDSSDESSPPESPCY